MRAPREPAPDALQILFATRVRWPAEVPTPGLAVLVALDRGNAIALAPSPGRAPIVAHAGRGGDPVALILCVSKLAEQWCAAHGAAAEGIAPAAAALLTLREAGDIAIAIEIRGRALRGEIE